MNVKIHNAKQLEAIEEEVENAEVMIATLNGLPGIMGFIHSRNVFQKEVITFRRLHEEEEARIIRREEEDGSN